jgi:hypothetical protein
MRSVTDGFCFLKSNFWVTEAVVIIVLKSMGYLLFDPVCYLEVGSLNRTPVIDHESF